MRIIFGMSTFNQGFIFCCDAPFMQHLFAELNENNKKTMAPLVPLSFFVQFKSILEKYFRCAEPKPWVILIHKGFHFLLQL
jgi:hypothetical protein